MVDWHVIVTVDGKPVEVNLLMTEDATWLDAALEALSFDVRWTLDRTGWSGPAGSLPVVIEINKVKEERDETRH